MCKLTLYRVNATLRRNKYDYKKKLIKKWNGVFVSKNPTKTVRLI